MKLTFILFFIATFHVNASSFAQNITLTVKNTSIEDIFTSLRKQSGYNFLYDPDVLGEIDNVSLSVRNAPLREVLNLCLKNQPISYVIKGRNVVIQRTKKSTPIVRDLLQDVTVGGLVTDTKGLPIPGVNVVLKSSNKAVVTDAKGRYSLSLPAAKGILVFTFIGYEKKELDIDGRTMVNVTLIESLSTLDDVVVIGYGSQSKRTVSGAVVKVKAEDLNFNVSTSFQSALEGQVAGLQVIQNSGQPGANVPVKIRSNPSPNANQGVLYVLDGVPINDAPATPGGNPYYGTGNVSQSIYNSLNSNDIESIDVLKDASAAAIYGARAGAGVILITTKKGKPGATSIAYNGSYAFQKAANVNPLFSASEYRNIRNDYSAEQWLSDNGIAPYFGTADAGTTSITNPYKPYYTPAQLNATPNLQSAMDAILRSGYINQHNLSLSGGTEKTSYVASGNYFDQKGTIIGTGIKRLNGRIRIDENVSSKLKIGLNAIGSNSTTSNSIYGGSYEGGGIVNAAQLWPADQPLLDADGGYPLNAAYAASPNPLSYRENNDHTKATRLFTSGTVDFKITSELTAAAVFSYDQQSAKRSVYFPRIFLYGGKNDLGGSASISESESTSALIDYNLRYQRIFAEKHAVNAIVGYSYNNSKQEGVNASNTTFFSDLLQYYNLGMGQSIKPTVGSFQRSNTWASYFARVIYTYDNNLTIQSSIRRDGNTAFAKNKKWGYFPSISASYILFDDPNLTKNAKINLLKLRVGYGQTGNSPNLTAGSAFELYGPGRSPNFGTGNPSTGVFLNQVANPNLTWETAAELNVGLDFSVFNDRIFGSVDVFSKTIRNLITTIPYPADFLVQSYIGNAGSTRDRGYEILLNSRNILPTSADGFSWRTSLTFSHYYDYWTKRSASALLTLEKYKTATGPNAPFKEIYGYVATEVYKGTYGNGPATMPGLLPGGLVVKDIHGYDQNGNLTGPDGIINGADQTLIGNEDPKFNFSIGNNFSYRNFGLSIFFTGQKIQKVAPWKGSITGLYDYVGQGWNTFYPEANNRWTTLNTNSNIPSGIRDPKYNDYQSNSSYYMMDATFFRCQDINLTYRLPSKLLKDQKTLKNLGVSFNVNNAFIITKYPYLDPQIDVGNFYPLTRSFVIGINAGF